MKKIQNLPFHPFLIAIYSVLALLALNISEVKTSFVVRPLIVLLIGTALLFLLLRLLLKNWTKAGLVTSIWLLLFVTYGHLYQFLKNQPSLGAILGRHRVLLPVYLILVGISLWLIWRKKTYNRNLNLFLNIIGILILVYPSIQLITAAVNTTRVKQEASQWTFSQPALQPTDPDNLPDVYFIVLDAYTRSDALAKDFSFDNSEFITNLENMGFYVAECSQTNYTYTQGAIAAALNLDYLPVLSERLESANLTDGIWILMKQSLVRHQLERLGYKTVAFETSYEWSNISDADIFLAEERSSLSWQQLNSFERMWVNSTALILVKDLDIKSHTSVESGSAHPWADHIQEQLFLLNTLPEIANIPDPTFTFAHILIPHVPYVFGANGEILTDPGYFGGDKAAPINEEYLQKGYTGEVAFIDSKMQTILAEILKRSKTPPIIVVMGDHGLRDGNRPKNLFAVYLPDGGSDLLYSSISPVNIFRVIFDKYFGTSYGLLPDVTYLEDNKSESVPVTCK
jgi:hypothetical protein